MICLQTEGVSGAVGSVVGERGPKGPTRRQLQTRLETVLAGLTVAHAPVVAPCHDPGPGRGARRADVEPGELHPVHCHRVQGRSLRLAPIAPPDIIVPATRYRGWGLGEAARACAGAGRGGG